MVITEVQRTRLRADYGDPDKKVFKDDTQIDDIWERLNAASDDNTHHRAALALMFEQTLNSAVMLHDYTAGQTGEKLSQVYNHLERRYLSYKPALDAVMGQQAEFATRSIRPRVRQGRPVPGDSY